MAPDPPVEPVAEPEDVRLIAQTDADEETLEEFISRATADNYEVNDVDDLGDYQRYRIETLLATLKLRGHYDRAIASGQSESSTIQFEGAALSELRASLDAVDPSGELAHAGLRRDADRTVLTTG